MSDDIRQDRMDADRWNQLSKVEQWAFLTLVEVSEEKLREEQETREAYKAILDSFLQVVEDWEELLVASCLAVILFFIGVMLMEPLPW